MARPPSRVSYAKPHSPASCDCAHSFFSGTREMSRSRPRVFKKLLRRLQPNVANDRGIVRRFVFGRNVHSTTTGFSRDASPGKRPWGCQDHHRLWFPGVWPAEKRLLIGARVPQGHASCQHRGRRIPGNRAVCYRPRRLTFHGGTSIDCILCAAPRRSREQCIY